MGVRPDTPVKKQRRVFAIVGVSFAIAIAAWVLGGRQGIRANDLYSADDFHLVVGIGRDFVVLSAAASDRLHCDCVMHRAIRGEATFVLGDETYSHRETPREKRAVDDANTYFNEQQDRFVVLSRYPDGQYLLVWQKEAGESAWDRFCDSVNRMSGLRFPH